MLQGMRFRPKQTSGSHTGPGTLPPPASFRKMRPVGKRNALVLVAVLFLMWFLNPLRVLSRYHKTGPKYPALYPLGSRMTVVTTSPYIYPAIEDADALRNIGVEGFFHRRSAKDALGKKKVVIESLNVLDDPNPAVQKALEDKQNQGLEADRAKNHFKNLAKLVFRSSSKHRLPKVVIVTAIDFNRYSLNALAEIVQNRVNYAHDHNYGIYVRWIQEFVPGFGSFDDVKDPKRAKWARLFCLRAAMFAFPDAEWFWYLDQDALIMNRGVNLESYLLSPAALRKAILREQPVMPPLGFIKTYKELQPENVKLIFTQSQHKIESNSFLVKNDVIGKAVVNTWHDKLFMNYNNFPYGPDSAIAHILLWHPYVLSKTALVSARMLNSFHKNDVNEEKKDEDDKNYYSGDLVVSWPTCSGALCENILKKYSSREL